MAPQPTNQPQDLDDLRRLVPADRITRKRAFAELLRAMLRGAS